MRISNSKLLIFAFTLSIVVAPFLCVGQSTNGIGTGKLKTVLTDVGPHSRTWIVVDDSDTGTNQQRGKSPARPIMSIETGMNYWDGTGWQPSNPVFEEINDAFVANKVQHPVSIAADNLNVVGAVKMTTPSGNQMSSTPVAIALMDPITGNASIIGKIQDCSGVLSSSNQIVYKNAFGGTSADLGVSADVVYTIEKGTFSQDVVITSRVDPGAWGYTTNAQLQIISEFYQAPVPNQVRRPIRIEQDAAIRARMAKPDFVDNLVDFGDFTLGQGKAYALTDTNSPGAEALVAKEFTTIQDRRFLVESVNYSDLQAELGSLPDSETGKVHARNGKTDKTSTRRAYASIAVPGSGIDKKEGIDRWNSKAKRVASARDARTRGVVIDYYGWLSSTNSPFTFTNGSTYYVGGAVIFGGSVTIEGGAILKYKTDASISLNSSAVCKTGPYNPAVFTAMVDESVGQSVQSLDTNAYSSTVVSNGCANPALSVNYPTYSSLNNLRFCYCKQAISLSGYANSSCFPFNLIDSQFVSCIQGISITVSSGGCGCGCGTGGVNLYNALFDNVQSIVSTVNSGYITAYANFTQCTVGKSQRILNSYGCGVQLNFTNSILANVGTLYSGIGPVFGGVNNGIYNSPQLGSNPIGSSSNPFQPNAVGAGGYYLCDNSAYRNAGLTTIEGMAVRAITNKTTYAPVTLTNTVATNITLQPTVQRDWDTPDLGYHYDPIDYIANSFSVTNATLIITNGTTIACYYSMGIWLQDGATIVCQGTPNVPNRFVDYSAVQEQPVTIGNNSSCFVDPWRYQSVGYPMTFRFTEFRRMNGAVNGYTLYCDNSNWACNNLTIRDCLFCGAGSDSFTFLDGTQSCFTNNLFDQDSVFIMGGSAGFCNNLIRGGSLGFALDNLSVIRNNAFDTASVQDAGSLPPTHDHNAYIRTSPTDFPTNTGDLILTNFTYAIGPLGFYYQVSTNLVDQGNGTADLAGLYHYTTQTNQVKEASTVVDVGLHYMATDANGNPIDSNGDGYPDYIQDINGNGTVDSGESTFGITVDYPSNGAVLP